MSENEHKSKFDILQFINRNIMQLISLGIVLVLLIIGREAIQPGIYIGSIVIIFVYLIIIISIEISKGRFRSKIEKEARKPNNNNN